MTAPNKKQLEDSERPFEYSRLRNWYLATLRKRIVSQMELASLTPAALITADRQAVYKLITDAAVSPPGSSTGARQHPLDKLLICSWVVPIFCQIPLLVMLVAWRPHLAASTWWILLLSTAVTAIISSLALAVSCRISVADLNVRLRTRLRPIAQVDVALSDDRLSDAFKLRTLDQVLDNLCQMLLQSTEREHAIADYALDFFCAIDREGRFSAVSPASNEFCGFVPHELIGRPFCEFIISDDVERAIKFLSSMRTAPGAVPFEAGMKHKHGNAVDVVWLAEWSATESACFCIGHDVSDQRRLERMRDEFISMVGHDLKTPITSVDCTLEILCEELTDNRKQLAEAGRRSIAQLLRLINQLLDLERMETGKLPMAKQRTALSEILKESVDSVLAYANRQGLKINLDHTDQYVHADAEKLQQVIVNLLSNAIKFSPAGGAIDIMVAVPAQTAAALIAVSDAGPGIPPSVQEKIFERFQQVSPADRNHGSGLGLSICRAIIQAHDGSIGVESEPGKGSKFWFTVPLMMR